MNAVQRLWRAFAQRDWVSAERQMHPHARISWPHAGELFADAHAYVTAVRLHPGTPAVHVQRVALEERTVAVLVRLEQEDGDRHCGGFYQLQDGRIASGIELWVPAGGRDVPPHGR